MGLVRDTFRLAPSGIVVDVPPDAAGPNVFNNGLNVVFRDGVPTRCGGELQVYGTPIAEPEFLLNLRDPLVNYWVYACQSKIGVLTGAAHYDITPTATLDPTTFYNEWTGGVLNGVAVVNNVYNDPVYWPGAVGAPCLALPGWPAGTRAAALRPFKYHLIAMNITDQSGDYSDVIMWSDAAEPGTIPQSWTPAPENQAGSVSLSAGGGNIIDAIQLRDQLFIFKDTSTWALQYVGGNAVFAPRKVLETSGMLSRNCAVEIKGALVVLTDSDVIIFDGQQAESLIDKKMRKFLFSQLDPEHYRNSYVVKNWAESEVWVCFPTTGNEVPNLALVWSREENAWGVREIHYQFAASGLVYSDTSIPVWDTTVGSWQTYQGIWNASSYDVSSETILGAYESTLQLVDGSVTRNGEMVEAWIRKSGIHLGDPQTRKLIKNVWPHFHGTHGTAVQVRVGASEFPADDAVVWGDPTPFEIGVNEKVDVFSQGRYLALQVSSRSEQPWQLTGFDVEYSTVGKF